MENETYRGLSKDDVRQRVEQGLVNETNTSVSKTIPEIIREHSLTYFNLLNLVLGIIVIISGQIKNITFMGVIFFNTIIGIFQELKVKKLVDGLSVITATKAMVIRSGKRKEIPIDQLVMDDIVVVESGNQISADSVVLESKGIEVNESMITGESRAVKKKAGDTLYSGSYLVAGSGIAKVEHVGKDNYAAQLAIQAKNKKRASSEMQDSIKRIIKIVGFVIIPVGILLFISQKGVPGTTMSDAMVSTVAGVVGMIPEGLVLLTSVTFILGVGRLAKKRALVQEMEAIESLARVDVLCTDKTGTVTTGELRVNEIVPIKDNKSIEDITAVMNEIAFAFDDVNSTQTALMNYFTKTGAWTVEDLIPFSSARKYRAIRFAEHGSYVLGAPDYITKDNEELLEKVSGYANQGLRVLLLGEATRISSEEERVEGITPWGLIVISDCIRPEAKTTFEYFASQGVEVKVISGDNPAAVSHIAVEAGLVGGEKYVDATQLPEDDADLRDVVLDTTVFGRVTPEQKQRIVKAYQANGKVVGFVGDGVNDVLALKDADCGIAMAAGSDAAKQVAHIVLLDSDFACMKDIVREGRIIISNIERVSALYMNKTIYSVLLSVIFMIIGRAYPFDPIQLTLINISAIGAPSFLLALEQTENVTKDGFLKHVLRISLPGALILVLNMLIVQLMGSVFGFGTELISSYNLIIAGFISLLLLIKVSSPLNTRRKILCGCMVTFFICGILFFGWFFNVTNVFQWRMLFIVPILFWTYPLMNYAFAFAKWITKRGIRV